MSQKTIRWNWIFSGIACLMLLSVGSCSKKAPVKVVPIAKVFDKYLYLSDIKHIFHDKMSKEDSISQAQAFIDSWIKNQLLLNKAELNLAPDQLDINLQIEAYRSSLLIYKYEDQMIKSKADTIVKDEEIENYYNQNLASFMLDDDIVKAVFIKLPKTAPDIDNFRNWYKSDKREDYKKLESYCYNYAAKYDYFNDAWVEFGLLQRGLPKHIDEGVESLKKSKTIEQQDDAFLYFVYIKDVTSKGITSPLNFVKPKIKDIILNKRKVKFLKDLETKIYNYAQDHNHFVIYNIENK